MHPIYAPTSVFMMTETAKWHCCAVDAGVAVILQAIGSALRSITLRADLKTWRGR